MIDERFVYLAFLFNLSATASYLIAVLKGHAKPNRVTWFLWALAPLIAFAAQTIEGVGLVSLMTFAVGFGPLLIFLASFLNKKSEWKISRFDYFCGAVSLSAILLWIITKDALLALIFAMLADLVACIPTLIKSWYYPETEEPKAYLLAGTSALITTATIKNWNFATYGFPIWTFGICAIFFVLIYFKVGKLISSR